MIRESNERDLDIRVIVFHYPCVLSELLIGTGFLWKYAYEATQSRIWSL